MLSLALVKTYSRLLKLLDRCSEVDGVTYLRGLSHNDLMAAWPWRWRDRCVIEQRWAMAVVNEWQPWLSAKPPALLDRTSFFIWPKYIPALWDLSGHPLRAPASSRPHWTGYCYLMHQSIYLKWQHHILVVHGSISLGMLLTLVLYKTLNASTCAGKCFIMNRTNVSLFFWWCHLRYRYWYSCGWWYRVLVANVIAV